MKNLKRLMITLLALGFCAGIMACGDDVEDALDAYCDMLSECDEDLYGMICDVDDDGEGEEGDISDECEDATVEYYECLGALSCDEYDETQDFEAEDPPCDAELEAWMDAC